MLRGGYCSGLSILLCLKAALLIRRCRFYVIVIILSFAEKGKLVLSLTKITVLLLVLCLNSLCAVHSEPYFFESFCCLGYIKFRYFLHSWQSVSICLGRLGWPRWSIHHWPLDLHLMRFEGLKLGNIQVSGSFSSNGDLFLWEVTHQLYFSFLLYLLLAGIILSLAFNPMTQQSAPLDDH